MVMRYALAVAAIAVAGASVAETPAERGEYLVQGPMGCGNCHTPKGPDGPIPGMDLAGFLVIDDQGIKAYAKNITPGGEVAGWSDAELARAIREGIRPDGSLIGPPMPFSFYKDISDSDLAAIVAYLRTVPAVENTVPDSVYGFPLPPAYGPPIKSVPDVPRGETVEYGHYLVSLAHCLECHTPMGPQGPALDTDLGRGGFVFRGPWGEVTAPNITSSEDGIADLTDDQLKTIITKGIAPDGSKMSPPMPYPYLARMTPEDLNAVILYIRTLPPLPDK
ncbi:MAG: c-type cytochrome [Rhodobacteraceae bacterium]|nr:c-type cytochrome [Paracoccaceae bacterium]